MDEEVIESYRKVEEITRKVHEWSCDLVEPGAKILEIANDIEDRIKELCTGIAFPINICINDISEHYAPIFSLKKIGFFSFFLVLLQI